MTHGRRCVEPVDYDGHDPRRFMKPSSRLGNEHKLKVRRYGAGAGAGAGARNPTTKREHVYLSAAAAAEAAVGADYDEAAVGADYGDDDNYVGAEEGGERLGEEQPAGEAKAQAGWNGQCAGFDADDKKNHLKRRFLLEFRFSMAEAAQNPDAASWQVDSSFFHAFQRREHGAAKGDMTKRKGDLSRVLLGKVKVNEVRSDVATTVVAQIDGVNGNAYLGNCVRTPLWITPGTQHIYEKKPMIFEADETTRNATLMQYSALDIEEVKRGLHAVPYASEYTFVPVDSPVCIVCDHNAEQLGFSLSDCPLFENRFYKIETRVVDSCLHTLRVHVFEKLPFCDFSKWRVTLARADGQCWDSPENVACMAEDGEVATYLLEKKNYVAIGLTLTYMICDAAVTKTSDATPA